MKQILVGMDDFVGPWVAKWCGANFIKGACSTIGLAEDGKIIAGVLYEAWNGANLSMHVAAEGRRWLTRDFLFACFDYPFNQLKVKRVTGLVPSMNLEAQRFDEHLGFRREAILKDAYPGGDLIIYSMFRDDCRWLNLKRHSNVNGIEATAGLPLHAESGDAGACSATAH